MRLRDYLDRLACALVFAAIGIVLAWNLWPSASRWHLAQAALDLAAQIDETEDSKVKIPLRQMAEFGMPAIDTLVIAAASQRAAVAHVARQILIEKLTNWQLRLAESRDDESSKSVAQLAASLAMHIDRFGHAGKQWAETPTLRMIELSENLTIASSGKLLSDCSRILAATPPPRSSHAKSSGRNLQTSR